MLILDDQKKVLDEVQLVQAKPIFVQVCTDTIHKHVQEFETRVECRKNALTAFSVAFTSAVTVATATFDQTLGFSNQFWKGAFSTILFLSLLYGTVWGFYALRNYRKTTPDYVVAQITGIELPPGLMPRTIKAIKSKLPWAKSKSVKSTNLKFSDIDDFLNIAKKYRSEAIEREEKRSSSPLDKRQKISAIKSNFTN